MENNLITFLQHRDLTLIVSLLCLAVVVSFFLLWRLSARLHQQQIRHNDLRKQMRALTSAALGMGERVLEMERRQKHLSERQ